MGPHLPRACRPGEGRLTDNVLAKIPAGMVEAGKQFRRVNGHLHLPTLRTALERQTAEPVGPVVHNDEVSAA